MNTTERRGAAEKLDRAALHIRRAQIAAGMAQAIAISRPETAREQAGRASDAAGRALAVLCDGLGATCPSIDDAEGDSDTQTPSGETLDLRGLDALDRLDTPETRALLAALEAALPVAEAVDEQRGNVLPGRIETPPGETRGIDLAESVGELVLRLRRELFGLGSGRE